MMLKDPVFKKDDVVICIAPRGYDITKDKEYAVLDYEPKIAFNIGFTWPAYVIFLNDYGKECKAHASRFVLKQEA